MRLRSALKVIRQNYGIALGVNAGGLVIGAMGALNPFIAAVLHNNARRRQSG